MAPRNGTRSRGTAFFSIMTLAFWQVRQTWRLLVVCGVGMLAATVLVCMVPLYSQVALSSGLHATLHASSANSSINVLSTLDQISGPHAVDTLSQQIDQELQNSVGAGLVDPQAEFVVHIGGTSILSPNYTAQVLSRLAPGQASQQVFGSLSQIQLVGLAQDQLASHIHLLQGRLPRPASNTIEIALLPSVAHCLFVYAPSPAQPATNCYAAGVGTEITILSPFIYPALNPSSPIPGRRFTLSTTTLHVVGLFTPTDETDPFWHGSSFGSMSLNSNTGAMLITGLTSSAALTAALDNAAAQHDANYVAFDTTVSLSWFYRLAVARIDAASLAALNNGLADFLNNVESLGNGAGPSDMQITASGPTDILAQFSSQAAQSQVPVTMLLLLVIGMVILFVSMVVNLLVERQAEAIALLRSRGANRRQVFGVFTIQMSALSLLALLVGPLLAIPLTVLLVQRLFSSLDPGAVALITTQPLASAWHIRWYALFAVGLALLSTLLTLYQATRFDVLALRREASRSTHLPFWQRFYLDGLLVILALVAYGYALYNFNTGTLDPATGNQVLTPLVMGAAAFLLGAGLLLFLRFLPRLVQLAGELAARRRGAISMLAFSQIARAPGQVVRTILLLTLATAFAIFSLVFSASQSQRIVDVVTYQVGADFSAQLPTNLTSARRQSTNSFSTAALAAQTASYRIIPGVLSATLGIMEPAQLGNSSLTIKAVDAETFAHTAIWTPQDSSQPLDALMTQLSASRKLAQDAHVVPALVDAQTWNTLHLSQGQHFILTLAAIGANGTQIPFLALAEVQHIPTMISTEGSALSSQGILVDDQSFATIFTKTTNQPPSLNYVWLHTRLDQNSLNSVRAALAQRVPNTNSGNLAIYDRQAFITTLQQDPLTLNLTGVLTIGALTPLLLALLGSLLLSWMSVRSRLLSFAVLRALGSSPAQLVGVLSWEQCIVYTLMLILGVLYGILLSALVLPSLILTTIAISGGSDNTVSTLSFQSDLPAIQIIIPPLLILVLGLLILACFLSLGLMARVVSHPSLSQILRLNAD